MMENGITHIGFSDESNWNEGRFRSLGLVTAPVEALDDLNQALTQLLCGSGLSEFKWKNLNGAKGRFAAQKMCSLAVDQATEGKLRVDVLIWDIQDSRHQVAQRDDIANLQRMYYHLFRNVLRARWPNEAVWRLHPDEHTALDWETVQDCLEAKSAVVEFEHSIFTQGAFRLKLRHEFGVDEISPVSSEKCPLLQLADLFAGLAVFSHKKFEEYQRWRQATSPQLPLPQSDEDDGSSDPSHVSEERFQVLKEFDKLCKAKKRGVSLREKRGLWTPKPQNPINFWMYEPQHSADRAPQKGKQ